MNTTDNTTVIIGPYRGSYVHLDEPKAFANNPKAFYSMGVLIPKDDTEVIERIEKAIENAKKEGWAGKKFKETAKLRSPLFDGDEPTQSGEDRGAAYKDHMYLTPKSDREVGVVDKNNVKVHDIETECYSGRYYYVVIKFFPYNNQGTGIGASLQGVMLGKDGDRLDNRKSTEQYFAGFKGFGDEDDDKEPAATDKPRQENKRSRWEDD